MEKKQSYEELLDRIKLLEEDSLKVKHFEEKPEPVANKLHYLYEGSRDGFVMIDSEGNITESNPAFREITGYTAEELSTLKYEELTPKKWHSVEKAFIERHSLNEGYSDLYEIEFRHKDDTVIPVEIRTYLILDDRGKVTGRWSVVRDISERRNLEEDLRMNEEKFRAIFDTSLDGMLITSPDGGILAANPAACKMFGYTEKEILSGGRSLLVDTDDPNFYLFLKERSEKGFYRGELTHVRKDGTKCPCEISSVLFKDRQGNDRTSLIIRDIS